MRNEGPFISSSGIERQGVTEAGTVYWNLSPARLCEMAVRRDEAKLASRGPLVCLTGSQTGRSPQDKFVVGGCRPPSPHGCAGLLRSGPLTYSTLPSSSIRATSSQNRSLTLGGRMFRGDKTAHKSCGAF